MSFDEERPVRRPRPVEVPRRRSPLAIAVFVVAVVLVLTVVFANVWTEVVWYQQVDYFTVWRTQWVARGTIFAVFALLAALAVWGSLRWARSIRP
ncbi:MAG: COG1615 family transporter, partial [Demequinaceae bacterium]|nr:COG1615 family transporter [Demequinaceae bacterium]